MKFPQGVADSYRSGIDLSRSLKTARALRPETQSKAPLEESSSQEASTISLGSGAQPTQAKAVVPRAVAQGYYTRRVGPPAQPIAPQQISQAPASQTPVQTPSATQASGPSPATAAPQISPLAAPTPQAATADVSLASVSADEDESPGPRQVDPAITSLASQYVKIFEAQSGIQLDERQRAERVKEVASFYGDPTRAGRLEALVREFV